MLYWSSRSTAPSPEAARARRARPSRWACRRWKSTRSSKSTCMWPGACSGRSQRWRGSTSSALTWRAVGGGGLRAMRSSVSRIIYRTMDSEAFRRFEQVGHDRLAATYGDFFAANTARAIEPLLDGAGVGAGQAVLDVACGPGHVAAGAARRGARVIGVDLSREMVARAARAHPEIHFREGDAEALPFGAAEFDAVVCNFGLGHFPRPEVAAKELARVLRPGGRLALTWWDDPSRSRINGTFLDAVAAAGAQPPRDLPPGPPAFQFSED